MGRFSSFLLKSQKKERSLGIIYYLLKPGREERVLVAITYPIIATMAFYSHYLESEDTTPDSIF